MWRQEVWGHGAAESRWIRNEHKTTRQRQEDAVRSVDVSPGCPYDTCDPKFAISMLLAPFPMLWGDSPSSAPAPAFHKIICCAPSVGGIQLWSDVDVSSGGACRSSWLPSACAPAVSEGYSNGFKHQDLTQVAPLSSRDGACDDVFPIFIPQPLRALGTCGTL